MRLTSNIIFVVATATATATVATGLLSPALVHASTVGYAATFEGSLSSISNFNSAGRANSFTVLGTGRYQVVFPGPV